MRGIKRVLLLILIVLIGSPIAIGALVLQSDKEAPTYFENFDHTEFDYKAEIDSKMQSIMMSNVVGKQTVNIDQAFVSKAIYTQLDAYQAFQGGIVELRNMWVTFDDNTFSLYGILAFNNTQTTFTTKLLFEDFDGETQVTFKEFKMGKLPIPKFLLAQSLDKANEFNWISYQETYDFGTLDVEDLTLRIDDSYLNKQLVDAFGSDMVLFKAIHFDDRNVYLDYDFNESNPEAKALMTAMQEVNAILTNKNETSGELVVVEKINSKLDLSDAIEKKASEDISKVMNLLSTKIQSSETSSTDFSETDQDAIKTMSESIKSLDPQKQADVTNAIIAEMDEASKAQIQEELAKITGDSDATLEEMIDQFLQGTAQMPVNEG